VRSPPHQRVAGSGQQARIKRHLKSGVGDAAPARTLHQTAWRIAVGGQSGSTRCGGGVNITARGKRLATKSRGVKAKSAAPIKCTALTFAMPFPAQNSRACLAYR